MYREALKHLCSVEGCNMQLGSREYQICTTLASFTNTAANLSLTMMMMMTMVMTTILIDCVHDTRITLMRWWWPFSNWGNQWFLCYHKVHSRLGKRGDWSLRSERNCNILFHNQLGQQYFHHNEYLTKKIGNVGNNRKERWWWQARWSAFWHRLWFNWALALLLKLATRPWPWSLRK